jgi:2-polyprenyl-3-methyl-5-hydroxy-6-metoxy-1,4-benzoquinol methylase
MVTGRIVEYDPLLETYALPPEHAAWLTRAAGANNLAKEAQSIPMLAAVEEPMLVCFQQGGGVPYAAYDRFQQVMAESSDALQDTALIDTTLPLVPGLVERLREGIDVLDVGCGRGHAINLMARAFPHSRFTGYDFSEEGIAAGTAEAAGMALSNARFAQHDVANLAEAGRYDLITAFDAIHDQAEPAQVLRGIAEALRPGGTCLMVDVAASSLVHENMDLPLAPFGYTISCLHCMSVSLAQGGTGLGAMWGEQTARHMLADAGFSDVEVRRVEADFTNNYYISTIR